MRVLRLACLVLAARGAASTGSRSPRVSRGAVLSALAAPPPSAAADPAFECAWRALAYEYAAQLQPSRAAATFAAIHDALELGSLCNESFVAPPARVSAAAAAATAAPAAATTFYIDYALGDDGAAGTQAAPFKTVAHGVAAARAAPQPGALLLRGGVHRLAATLQLGAADAGLTIAAYPGEAPVLTSGLPLKTDWQPAQAPPPPPPPAAARAAAGTATRTQAANCTWTTFAAEDAMYDDWPSPNVADVGAAASAAACEAKCVALGAGCFSWTWYAPAGNFGPPWSGHCFARSDATWAPSPQQDTYAGYCAPPPVPPNVWVADLAGSPVPAALTAGDAAVPTLLFSPDGGASPQRAIRARWPNADPERDLFPHGWASGGARASVKCNASDSNVTAVPLPSNYGPGMFSDYQFGEGGPCSRFATGEWLPAYGPTTISYWCAPGGRTAGCQYFVNSPTGFTRTPAELPRGPSYDAAALVAGGAVLQYWRNGHWFSMAVKIAAAAVGADNSTALSWTYGAFQGAEGDASGEDWYVDHVREELDAPREFFLDAAAQRLYYFHNASAGTPPPAGWTFEVPALAVLINISGTPAAPAAGITLGPGLTFTGAAATILSAHGIPSGGDWGLSRLGAVLISGAERVTLTGSTFSRLDGNAVFLSGYTRNVTVDGNEFAWLGESAVASWGFTAGVDATAGTQPWYTRVTNNICREIGHMEKQVSCYFAATSHAATIEGNIFFNMPRAAVNFNDDMAGGSKMMRNLIWNTCRESQDHGPFNSWGRVPYLFPFPNGTANGLKPYVDELAFNFIVAGGGANGGSFDHDDGSSFYHDHDNFEVYGGHKSDFDGHAKLSYNNVHAYSNVYGSKCVGIMNLPHASPNAFFAEGYFGNKCVLADAGDGYLDLGSPCSVDSTLANRMILGNNSIYAPGASVTVSCGKSYDFAAWQATGADPGTTVAELPSAASIISWARALLQMQ